MTSLTRHELSIAGRQILLDLPADPEALLNAAVAAGDSSDPYWGILWDAAVPTAQCILQSSWQAGSRILEIGCGAGLVGIAGLLAGLDVMFSDLVPDAVQLAVHNAALNGFSHAAGTVLDWRSPGEQTFDVILGSDVLYQRDLHSELLQFLEQTLRPGGACWIGDPGRPAAIEFLHAAAENGWGVQLQDDTLQPVGVPSLTRFQLLILRRQLTNAPE